MPTDRHGVDPNATGLKTKAQRDPLSLAPGRQILYPTHFNAEAISLYLNRHLESNKQRCVELLKQNATVATGPSHLPSSTKESPDV